MASGFKFSDYPEIILAEEARPDSICGRLLVCDVPRQFHQLPGERQVKALQEPPDLTGTKWDALLAAMAEHVARLHDHPIPDWCNEPERFLAPPHLFVSSEAFEYRALLYCPGAFIRHGALIDPLELDHRGGERSEWIPRL